MTTRDFIFEAIGVLGFATNVWANIMLARLNETGWAIRLGANVLWLTYGLAILSVANILSSVVFAGINVYGWRNWRRKRGQLLKPACTDHYRIECIYCREIVRQCRCHGGLAKPVTRNGVCGSCASQLPEAKLLGVLTAGLDQPERPKHGDDR